MVDNITIPKCSRMFWANYVQRSRKYGFSKYYLINFEIFFITFTEHSGKEQWVFFEIKNYISSIICTFEFLINSSAANL